MTNCINCGNCSAEDGKSPELSKPPRGSCAAILVTGNKSTGKTTLFGHLCGSLPTETKIRGMSGTVSEGKIKGTGELVYDISGANMLFSGRQDDRIARDILLRGAVRGHVSRILIVADAKNLKRSIALALQYAEYELPLLLALNMTDEAELMGIRTDCDRLEEVLGVPVCETTAREGKGIEAVFSELQQMRRLQCRVKYPEDIERFLDTFQSLVPSGPVAYRAAGLLMLSGDGSIRDHILKIAGEEVFERIANLADALRVGETLSIGARVGEVFNKRAEEIGREVQYREVREAVSFSERMGGWSSSPKTGVPIALMILVAMYYFIGAFGATYLVDTISETIFEGYVFPFTAILVEPIPSAFVRDLIMDADFGVMQTGVFLALGLVMPVIFCFYIVFGILEEVGYIHRLSILFDKVFQRIGLNGKGVIPLVMGFSCVTMAILTTRVLNSEKEKNIAAFLLFLVMPCSPLLAVMVIILNKQPASALITVFGIILSQMILAGYLTNKILPGEVTPLLIEIPSIRFPRPLTVIKSAGIKTLAFMKEALPVFISASVGIFVFERSGGLRLLEHAAGPFLDSILGLPENSVQVFIKTIVRRESGATELLHLGSLYTNLQIVTAMIVMIFITPCINSIIVLFKERGFRAGFSIVVAVMAYAILIGCVVNYTCRFLGVTFS